MLAFIVKLFAKNYYYFLTIISMCKYIIVYRDISLMYLSLTLISVCILIAFCTKMTFVIVKCVNLGAYFIYSNLMTWCFSGASYIVRDSKKSLSLVFILTISITEKLPRNTLKDVCLLYFFSHLILTLV